MTSRFLFGFFAAAAGLFAQSPSKAPPVDFNREIRPILSDRCFTCHGPDEQQRKAGLRLDTKEGAFERKGVIVPSDSAASRLLKRVAAGKRALQMPPPGSGNPLTEKEVDLLRRWIDQGAGWETHWAYAAPKRVEPPPAGMPKWVRNPIDNFVLARLEKEGLKPAREADKTTLLRRLSFDLTGLPPTPAEVDAFLLDKSPAAYGKKVDELLNSPRYGERMAMQWLDLARYADTHGYHIDSHRDMWPWRDWVIEAFNANMPFDRFTTEQLAGDLLPNPTSRQLLATGFNRNHMINFEGGAIPEEYQTEYVVDRVDTTSTVWMGMTMGCARCHDHKYDPIKQKEFYEFFAFFNSIPEKGLDGRAGNAEPVLALPSPSEKDEMAGVKARIESLEEELCEDRVKDLQSEWEKSSVDGAINRMRTMGREGLVAHYDFDGHSSDISGGYRHARAVRGGLTWGEGAAGQAASFDGESQISFADLAIEKDQPFSIAVWFRPAGTKGGALVQKISSGSERRGVQLLLDESTPIGDLKRGARLIVNLTHRWPEDSIQVASEELFAQNDWRHVLMTYDGSAKATGIQLYVDGSKREVKVLQDTLTGSIATPGQAFETGNKTTGIPYKGQLDDLRFYGRALTLADSEHLAVHHPVDALVAQAGTKRSDAQKARLREYFLTRQAPAEMRDTHASLARTRRRRTELEKTITTTMVMQEMSKPRDTYVLARGDYRNHGEKVTPSVPAALNPLPSGAPLNRLGLAQWLMDPSHPLTSRVAVNRYWQMYFGTGLVKTVEDFGSQGEAPSHPELLDWLATEFIRTGWDVKNMQRLIVTSATYRQDSRVTPDLVEKDPENRLLARGARFRLPAETVRDNALTVSGLLNPQIGGESVYPYQPKGVWEEIAYGDVFSAQSYTPSTGKDLYRRSMYTFWKRTAPPPSLNTFDAPDREKCTARRARTNTPLQALVLLNDPTYVESAQALAQRVLLGPGKESGERVRQVFKFATARAPQARELAVLKQAARDQLAIYRKDPEAARKLLSMGEFKASPKLDPAELAAWTNVASIILNLDEAITKE